MDDRDPKPDDVAGARTSRRVEEKRVRPRTEAEGGVRAVPLPLLASAAGLAVLALAVAITEPWLLPVVGVTAAATAVMGYRLRRGPGLQIDQIDRLRQAELALAAARSTEDAARELAEHARALLGAPSAVVLIEGIGDTVRVTAGDTAGSVFGDGSRMRLLDDDGLPCGSIAVSARADGRAYTAQQETMLDALAQRVSSTLHRLSLFTEVQAERRMLTDVIESSSDGIFTVGLDMAVGSWNPAMASILGVPAEDALGHPVGAVFRPVGEDGRPRFGQADPGRHGEPVTLLVTVEGSGGEDRWLTCSWSPLSEGGYVVVARDETERKKLQDDKDGWIAQVSHELRTPLTPIKGFLHTLQRRDHQFTTEDRQRIYEVMLREEQRLEDLVNGLLQATTLDQRGLIVVAEVIDWVALIREQTDVYRRNDPSRTITVEIDRGVSHVVADVNLATGILSNLLSNALKYSPDGTAIVVTATVDHEKVITTVEDDGPGIARDDRERIFEKFTRLGDHLTRPQQGVGLGLYIARRSLDEMGGEIWCDERPGGGARFGFSLPAHKAPKAAKPGRSPATSALRA